MIKWIVRLFLLGVVILFLLGVFAYFNLKTTHPPSIKDAQYAVQQYYEDNGIKVPTRYFFTEKVEVVNRNALMTVYWTFDGEKYKKHKGTKEVEPPFSIIRRSE